VRLVAGIAGLNLGLLAAGYCVLSAPLAGLGARVWASFAGVALLLGAALVGVAVFGVAVLGATTGPVTFALAAALVAASGLALRAWPRARTALAAPLPEPRAVGRGWETAVATAAAFGVAVLCLAAVVGGFRSSPWLDDAWGIWLPKGIALGAHGLDERLFVPNGEFVFFEVPDYPLWWAALAGLDVRVAGGLDLRALNAQLALLTVGFVAAAARLLWGHARPWLIWLALLGLVASPELLRHTQSGMADLPLALYLSLFLLSAAAWLALGRGFHLLLAFAFAAASLAIKTEGLPQVAVYAAVLSVVALPLVPRRVGALWGALGAALLTFAPWLAWRAAHGIEGRVALGDALDPGFLSGRADRVGRAAEALAGHLVDPSEWLLVVPLALVLSVAAFVRTRRIAWLSPALVVLVGWGFWTWAYWADRDEIGYLVATSSYRVVDPIVLAAALAIPVLAERLLSPL
jgi:hypothetical protein